MNEKFIRERYVRYGKKIKNGYVSDRKRILREYNEENEPITERQLKRFITDNNLISLLNGDKIEEEKPKESVTRYEDGSVLYDRLIALHDNDMNDDTIVLKSFNLDPSKWVITSATFNLWSVDSKDRRLNNYQAKVKVKPKKINDLTLNDFKDIDREFDFKFPKFDYKKISSNKELVLYIADDHVAQFGYDLKETYQWVNEIKESLKNSNHEKMSIVFLGDILHVDNDSKTTARGTQLETQTDSYDMAETAHKHISYIVKELSTVKTNVYWVQGNHARQSEFILMQWVKNSFINNDHINFTVDKRRRKAFTVYDWLIGIFHGDMPNTNKGYWLSDEFSELWGKSKYREQYEGHLHHRGIKNFGSLQHNTMTTKAKQTDYEYGLGYDNHRPNVELHTYYKGSLKKNIETF